MSITDRDADGSSWTLITVTYNSSSQLRECWAPQQLPPHVRWIVVDNASSDDSAGVARSLGAEVVTLRSNAGFSAANNVGLTMTTTDWVGFINPDVSVDATDLAQIALTSRECNALVAPQLTNVDGTNQANARGLPFLAAKIANRSRPLTDPRVRDYARADLVQRTYIAWAMGAAVLGPTSAFRDLGGWDDQFFIYYEDHDLGLRAWTAGLTVVLEPAVRWKHQWQRETLGPRIGPWRHEIASMHRFYSKYPYLLTRGRYRRHSHHLTTLSRRVWSDAP